ncbi:gliding motility-associated C-terminal domain-containing protein [Ulvibacterium marinum]|uniref:gliding motility-associated C-terminal domain-containing protein n=1 Tax=Ulvibacterium marinum TaxID=2419782 RepID=UPI002494CD59|nr:gliding motility-associated C-terminal domain-containing protein [Ulvibacterium marinum]
MKDILCIMALLGSVGVAAQTALYNSGNIRIHEEGQLGFHTDLINDSAFDENLGLAGFYGGAPLTVSGAFIPLFFDVELANNNGVLLQVGLDNANNTNFISGDFLTPRNQSDVTYNFLPDAFYVGEGNFSKVNGYAEVISQQNFTFPIGDNQQLRPLILNSEGVNPSAKCAYFLEDPNNPISFNEGFDTENRPRDMGAISTVEFWRLVGNVSSTVSISWNERSNMAALTDDVSTVVPVGWNKSTGRWERLGEGGAVGDLNQGFVVSAPFIPDNYEILTFGVLGEPTDILDLDNYLITPNGDGLNDFLTIPELEQSPNNILRIYDRNGLKVFEKRNYVNEFNGFSNVDNMVIAREKGLPIGIYFYIVSMEDLNLDFQGFLYLSR